jgi:hypothetical protein
MIPGVVDGTVTASSEPDGTVSFRIAIGDRTGRGDYVELVVSGEHAGQLGATLLTASAEAGAGTGAATVPCSVGIRLSSGQGT